MSAARTKKRYWSTGTPSRAHLVALSILCDHPNIVICFDVEALEGELRCSFLLRPLSALPHTWRACTATGLFRCEGPGATGSDSQAAVHLHILHSASA